jgi:hypothetical protein
VSTLTTAIFLWHQERIVRKFRDACEEHRLKPTARD